MNNRRIRLLCTILVYVMTLTGCSEWLLGDGRGDIKIPLKDEYYIFEVNSYSISFCKKKIPEELGYQDVIDRYFVTMYYVENSYICLGGIHTETWSISAQERKDGNTAYYLFNTDNCAMDGPYYDLKAFESYCNTKGFSVVNNWLLVSDYR